MGRRSPQHEASVTLAAAWIGGLAAGALLWAAPAFAAQPQLVQDDRDSPSPTREGDRDAASFQSRQQQPGEIEDKRASVNAPSHLGRATDTDQELQASRREADQHQAGSRPDQADDAPNWTEVQAMTALAQLFVSALAVLLLWRTLIATAEAVREARAATDAANKSVEVADRTAHAQLRPYVHLAGESLSIVPAGGLLGDTGEIVLTIRNYGQTPARRVRLEVTAAIGGHYTDPPPCGGTVPPVIHLDDIPPGAERLKTGFYVGGMSHRQHSIQAAEVAVFVSGRLTYGGEGQREYTTQFRRAWTGEGFFQDEAIVTAHGNVAT